MDLTLIPDATLLKLYTDLSTAILTGQRLSAASYAQGNGSKSVSYLLNSNTDLRASLALVEAELRRRGLLATPARPRRRAIGIRF